MRWLLALAAVSLAAAGSAAAEPSVEITNAAVNVVVVPEARSDVEVRVLKTSSALPLYIEHFGDRVVVDGRLWPMWSSCHGRGAGTRIAIFGKGDFGVGDLPQIIVKTPMDSRVSAGGLIVGSVGRSHSLELHHGGCGSWTVANVEQAMVVSASGSGDVETGSAGSADLTISGSGKVRTGPVKGQFAAVISGSGDVDTASTGDARIRISGSGDIRTGPVIGGMDAQVSGSGDVRAASLSGPLVARITGAGRLSIPKGEVTTMEADITGSGDVDFGGRAESLDARISGVGDVRVADVTGAVSRRVSGMGRVTIGH
jgi:hypothetical protein